LDGALPALSGSVDPKLIGTMTRSDETVQLTYNGWPLYFYAEDINSDDINGHDIESFGEDWYLIGPMASGRATRATETCLPTARDEGSLAGRHPLVWSS
jgi:hypothetical protein